MKKFYQKNQQVKEEIKQLTPTILVNSDFAHLAPDGNIICPNCGNGSGEDGTGVIFSKDANGYYRGYCHRCGSSFDNLNLIAKHFGYDIKADFKKVLAEGATLLGASSDFHSSSKNLNQNTEQATLSDYSKFLESAFLNLEDLPEKARRGLDLTTLIHFNCGFVSDWQHPNSPKMPKTPRWIIPTSKFHYLARAVSDSVQEKFRKIHVGHKEIFNFDALKENSTVVVVEGEIDAMSIWQATNGLIPVVAVSGCSNFKILLNWLDNNPNCNCSFIVMFDNDSKNDNAGQTNSKKFVNELIRRGFPAVNSLLSDKQDFDANDWLQENPDSLRNRLFELYDDEAGKLQNISADIMIQKDFNKKVADFEKLNGKIDPAILDDIKTAAQFITSLKVETFDADLLIDSTFIHQLGLCSFYSFVGNSLNNFWDVFNSKRKLAVFKNRNNLPLDDSEKSIRNFSETDVRRLIKKSAKFVEKQHEDFNKEQKRQERQRKQYERQQHEEQIHAQGFDRLVQLKKMPPSEERDDEMRQLILDLCEWHCDRYGNPVFVKPSNRNFDLIFEFDPVIEGLFAYNAFTGSIVFTKEPFWRTSNSNPYIGENFKNSDYDILFNYISRVYGDIEGNRKFKRYITEFATRKTFHPIKDYFKNLPAWDGIPRAEKIFIDYLGVEDSPYSREVSLNFFIAALARIYHPGCEYQYMPVFQGEQGIGKGKLIKYLVDSVIDSGYVELNTKLHDSHAIDILKLAWFVEMPEMSSTKGVSNAVIKSFISARSDSNRFAYEKDPQTLKRHNVFFSTINEKFFLKDKTGNRRFLILQSHLKENQYVEGLTDDYIVQFWAEVFAKYNELFKNGFDENKLLLSKESIMTAADLAREFTEDDGLTGEILAFLDSPIPYLPVWRLMSKDERRKFFANGGSITLYPKDLRGRQFARRRPDEMAELEAVLELANFADNYSVQSNDDGSLTFYGFEYRNSICASEVYNECFYSYDNRKVMYRIAEILASNLPDSWHKERRKNTIYGDQPNTYVRDLIDNEPEQTPPSEDSVQVADNDTTKQVDSNDVKTDSVTNVSTSDVYVDDEEFLEEKEIADDDSGLFLHRQ